VCVCARVCARACVCVCVRVRVWVGGARERERHMQFYISKIAVYSLEVMILVPSTG